MELDRITVERARQGDRRAQDAFLRRYVGPLHHFVRRSAAPGEPDDLVQELLGKLLVALPKFDPEGTATLTTWVFSVAHHWVIDLRRRRHLAVAPLEDGHAVADPSPGPEAIVHEHQLGKALELALQRLPEAQRRVFLLAQVHAQSLEAIAEVEGVPVGTIKSRLHRARAAIVAELAVREAKEGKAHAQPRRA